MCSEFGCSVASLVFGIIVLSGLLAVPAFICLERDDFDLKPVEFYGCHWTRAWGASLGVALLASVVVILHIILFCLDDDLAGWTAGLAMFISFFAFLFNINYWLASRDTLRDMKWRMMDGTIDWEVRVPPIRGNTKEFQYDLVDWGKWFSDCNGTTNLTVEACITERFTDKYEQYDTTGSAIFFYSCGATLVFLFFFINPDPLVSLAVVLLLAVITSLFGLPVYAATLWNRNLSRLFIDNLGIDSLFEQVLAFSWTTSLLLLLGWILIFLLESGWCTIPLFLAACLEIANVVTIVKISGHDLGYFASEWKTLTLTAIPHYILFAIVVLLIIAGFCYLCCCSDSGGGGATEAADSYVVVFVQVKVVAVRMVTYE